MANSISKSFVYSLLGTIVPGILSFLFIPFVVNLFGGVAYAEYSLAVNALNIIVLFCYGWVGQSYIRFFSSFNKSFYITVKRLLAKSLWIGLPLFITVEFFFAGTDWERIIIIIPAFFILGNYNFFLLTCQAQQKTNWLALSESIRACLNIILPILLYFVLGKENTFEILVFSITTAHLMPLLLYGKKINPGYKNKDEGTRGYISAKEIQQQVISYGIPIAFFLSFSLALSVNDRYFIARFINYEASGKYSALYDIISRSVTVGCAPIIMTFYPYIVKLYNGGDKQGAFKNLQKAILIEIILFIAGLVFLFFFGIPILNLLFSNQLLIEELNLILLIYTGVFLWQFSMLLHKTLELRLKTKQMAIGVLVAFVCNITANYFLINHYRDVTVAAYTTVGSSLLYILYVLLFSLKKNS